MSPKSKTAQTRPEKRLEPGRIAFLVAVGVVCQFVYLFVAQTVLAEYCAYRAQQASAAGRVPVSAEWARRSLALNPHQGYAAYFEGLAERAEGRTTPAAADFRRALETMPHRAQPLSELAVCEETSGDVKTAAVLLFEALAIEPLPPNGGASAARLGRLFLARRDWADGIARFRSVIPDSPHSRFLFDGLGLGYERLEAWDVAVASAFVLLGSPQLASRACERLLRVSNFPGQRPTVLLALQEFARGLRPDDPRRAAVTNLLQTLAAER